MLLAIVVAFAHLPSHVWRFATPWTAARQASLSLIISWSLLKLTSIESVMPSNHLILCRPLLLLPAVFPISGSFLISRLLAIKEAETPSPGRAAPSRQQTQSRLIRTDHPQERQAELKTENRAFPGKYQHTWPQASPESLKHVRRGASCLYAPAFQGKTSF